MSVVKGVLSVQSIACIEKLKALDLSPIAAYLMNPQNGYGWRQQQVFRAIRRYKTFLFVTYLHPEILLVPTQEVDLVWHCHILHTRKYRQDCQLLFGYFIDHEPDSEFSGEAEAQNLDVAFAQTQVLLAMFEKYFETDVSGEFELDQDIEIKLTQQKFGSENTANTGNLHLYRIACGRPSTSCVHNK